MLHEVIIPNSIGINGIYVTLVNSGLSALFLVEDIYISSNNEWKRKEIENIVLSFFWSDMVN